MRYFGYGKPQTWQHRRTSDIRPIELQHTWVVTMCSNPGRYRSRYDAHRRFIKHMSDSGAQVVVVEVAYGKREFEVTEAGNPLHVQLRSEHEEVWLKEPCWNIGLSRLSQIDPLWAEVIFCDNDITFMHPRWLNECVHQLQSHMIVQPFSKVIFMGPDNNPEVEADGTPKVKSGFAYMYHQNMFQSPKGSGYGGYYGAEKGGFWHPGFCMAFRRECFEGAGLTGLLEVGVLGAGDHHMWLSLISQAERSLPAKVHPNYRQAVLDWQKDADRVIKGDIGYCEGMIAHTFGGPEQLRFYVDRWALLGDFDPAKDIRRDWQGLPQLVTEDARQRRLRDMFRAYFRKRAEDSVLAETDKALFQTKEK